MGQYIREHYENYYLNDATIQKLFCSTNPSDDMYLCSMYVANFACKLLIFSERV